MKYFVESMDTDGVESLQFYKDELIEDELEEMELFEMKRDIGGPMWCEENEAFIEKGDCGYHCSEYNPSNYKRGSGRCRYLQNGFVETGKKFLLTKDGLMEVIS